MNIRRTVPTLALVALLTVFCAGRRALASGPVVLEPGKGFAHIYAGGGSTGNYYNINGTVKPFDSVETKFNAIMFGLSFDYGLIDGLELNVELPMGYFSVTSAKKFPDRSVFSPVHLGIGGTYSLIQGAFSSTVSSMLKIPPGFHDGIYDDPAHPSFLSDGFLQLTTALNAGYVGKTFWTKGSIGYNWRGEEPLDEILYNVELGFSRVEGTGIFVAVGGVTSTGDVTKPLRPFYAGASGEKDDLGRLDGGTGRLSTIDRETYLAISGGAFVFLTDQLMLDGRYNVRLMGKNTLNLQAAFIGVGYRF